MRAATKSKTLATWIALVGGTLGLHRFYLHGFGDRLGWLFCGPTLLGWHGVRRMQSLGIDDRLAWLLSPLLGITITIAMLSAIVYGLTSDAEWNRRHNPTRPAPDAGWAAIVGVIVALALGATALMATLAFSAQRLFEWQAEPAATAARAPARRPGPEPAAT
ncbi:MAG: hypothetical protein ABIX46_10655 [Burkholderiaceae bacterium]